jgi:hypothetical protein
MTAKNPNGIVGGKPFLRKKLQRYAKFIAVLFAVLHRSIGSVASSCAALGVNDALHK